MLGLRRFSMTLAALAAALVTAAAAAAGPLLWATLTVTTRAGVATTSPSSGPDGAFYTDGVASVFAGSSFSGFTAGQRLTTNTPITYLRLSAGANGRIRVYPGAPVSVTATAPLAVTLNYGNAYGTIFKVPLHVGAGSAANPLVLTHASPIPFVGSVLVTLTATGWHLGQVQATGLTVSGSPIPDVTLQGSANLVPSYDLGYVTLVSLARVRTSTVYSNGTIYSFNHTATGLSLSLSYDNTTLLVDPLPEPGTGLLLAAAAAGLVARGRRRAGT